MAWAPQAWQSKPWSIAVVARSYNCGIRYLTGKISFCLWLDQFQARPPPPPSPEAFVGHLSFDFKIVANAPRWLLNCNFFPYCARSSFLVCKRKKLGIYLHMMEWNHMLLLKSERASCLWQCPTPGLTSLVNAPPWRRRSEKMPDKCPGGGGGDVQTKCFLFSLSMLCCFMLCYVTLRYVMLCYVMLCYVIYVQDE